MRTDGVFPPDVGDVEALDPHGDVTETEFLREQRQGLLRPVGGETRGPEGVFGVPSGDIEERPGFLPASA